MQSPTTLVIGSTGKTGRRVARRLANLGHDVRRGSRKATPPFDWQDQSTWPQALDGVEAVYISYFPDLAVPEAPAAIGRLVEDACSAGVRKLVLLSGRGEANAQRCEQIVRDSGLGYTIIRASWFAQNFSEGALLGPVLSGVVAMPAGDVREPFVDVDDIADVAVAALTDDRHDGQLYELTGPRLLSFHEVASELSAVTGRQVHYQPVTFEAFEAALSEEVGLQTAHMFTELCREVLDGRNESLADGVTRALGREPRDFRDFAREAARTGVWRIAATAAS